MSRLFERLQQQLYTESSAYWDFIYDVAISQKDLQGLELVLSYCILRLGMALQHWQETGLGASDVIVLMRQVIRSYERRIEIPRTLWQKLSKYSYQSGLLSLDMEDTTRVQIVADDWCPHWLSGTRAIDRLQRRRNDQPSPGDGLLYAMTDGRFYQYQSQAQQIAVHTALFAEPGSTLLVMLPTGSGKSLVALLPAWLSAQDSGGTTLVVVPTVALALDQEQKARSYFEERAPDSDYLPCSWTGQTPPETREQILQSIRNGRLPILYLSPEALMQSSLYTTCLEAAEHGMIKHLVIDEAHIVDTWGAGFRTEFQFLATYRTQLLTRSGGQLRTLLLSATIRSSTARLLKQLFGSNGRFYEVSANRLRPEPSYWFSFSQYPQTRERRVLEALRYLPRPLILYVSTLDNASHWQKLLSGLDFRRVAMFTGSTNDNERLKLIQDWNNSKIDIMVATSAFGMGVDKSDVRTIVHACLPENIERFYQEVGRAGRDGYSSVSLLCATVYDYQVAESLIRGARITTEKAIKRWEGMRQTATFPIEQRNDLVLVDTNAPPAESPDMRRSKANRRWNEHTLLLMQRAGLIRITNTREDMRSDIATIDTIGSMRADALQIQLLQPTITAYSDSELPSKLEVVRNQERQEVEAALEQMKHMVQEYTEQPFNDCLAHHLIELYSSCSPACGGCPYCRANGIAPYEGPLVAEIEQIPETFTSEHLYGELRLLMGRKAVMNVTWDATDNDNSLKTQFLHLLTDLIWAGMQQLLLPDDVLADQQWAHELYRQITSNKPIPHRILAHWEIFKGTPFYTLPTVIIYPFLDVEADIFHRRVRPLLKPWSEQRIPLLHIVRRFLFLECESGYFMDRIDGKTETLPRLQALLAQWQEPKFF